jgi:hypothetical protein
VQFREHRCVEDTDDQELAVVRDAIENRMAARECTQVGRDRPIVAAQLGKIDKTLECEEQVFDVLLGLLLVPAVGSVGAMSSRSARARRSNR